MKYSFGAHDGTFHADEVTACALLLLFELIDRNSIVRTRDLDILNQCEYVCDVGGLYDEKLKRFDHHQVSYQGELSSAGMILKYLYNQKIINEKEYLLFNNSLVRGVDAFDNGRVTTNLGFCSFSNMISNFLPVEHGATRQEMDQAFFEALDLTYGHLKRLHSRYKYNRSCCHLVEESMKKYTECLMFEESIPWMESFFELNGLDHPARFIIMPTGEHWKLRGIPPSQEEKIKVRQLLPKKWEGLLDEELKKASGIDGAIFCHKGRFISVWKTKEDAQKALKFTLNEKRNS
ncbi:MAG: hypothetical protein S4CHLAM6_07290 [Chlamydiae bacterium]|nr:hypothetical protein [Chlamydiota bacterium]